MATENSANSSGAKNKRLEKKEKRIAQKAEKKRLQLEKKANKIQITKTNPKIIRNNCEFL